MATPIYTPGLALSGNSGRVSESSTRVYRFYAGEGTTWQVSPDVIVNITNDVPDPAFTITSPAAWNGCA